MFIGYFIPGVRHLTAIFAGIAVMPYRVFAMYAFAGGLLWTVTFVTMGYYLGEKWKLVYTYSYRYILPFAILAIVIFLLINFLITNNRKYNGNT